MIGMNDKKDKNKKEEKATKKAIGIIDMKSPKSDPGGSYTGKPEKTGEIPVQDADDL